MHIRPYVMFLIKQLISCLRLIDDDDYVKIDVTRKDGGGGGGNADNDNNSEEGKKTRAMVKISYGSGGRLAMRRLKSPQIERDDQVLIRIVAAGVHSSDMLPTCSIPGQDCSGIITAVGDGVTQWKVGDKVCAILDGGGGYAEEVLVSAGQILAVPSTVTLADAASLPYAACNICLALSTIPQGSNKSILINGATTEIGVIAIQVAKYWGFKVIAAAGTKNGMYLCRKLGADISFDETDGEQYPPCEDETVFLNGVDIVLECGACIEGQIRGRMKNGATRVIVELDMASKYGLNLNEFCLKNRRLKVVNIRRLSKVEKASIVEQVRKNIWPAIEQGKVKPRIAYRAPLMAAMSARKLLTDDERYGSVLLYP